MKRALVHACLLVALGELGVARAAWAQTDDASRAAARELGTAGVEAYQRDDFTGASGKLEKAYKVLKAPSLGLWSARALVKLGQLVKAAERYREVARLPLGEGDTGVQKQAQSEAQNELDALVPRLPRVVIKLNGAVADDVVIKVDGVAISSALVGESRPIDPGKHVVEASQGAESVRVEVSLAEGETKDALLEWHAAPTAPGAAPKPTTPTHATTAAPAPAQDSGLGTRRTLALVVGGVGLVGVGIGSVFGLKAKSHLDDANRAGCSGSICPNQSALDTNDDAIQAGNISTIAFAVGAAFVAGGAVLWLTGAPEEPRAARLGVGPGGLRIQAVW